MNVTRYRNVIDRFVVVSDANTSSKPRFIIQEKELCQQALENSVLDIVRRYIGRQGAKKYTTFSKIGSGLDVLNGIQLKAQSSTKVDDRRLIQREFPK